MTALTRSIARPLTWPLTGPLGNDPGQGGGGATEPDYFTAFAPQDTWASQVSGPFGTYYNGNTYICFQGPKYDLYVAVYNHASKALKGPYFWGTGQLTTDAHGHGAILVDDQGKIHVIGRCHVTPIKYTKSNNAEDASEWTDQSNIASEGAYPRIFQTSDNTLWLFYRAGGHLDDWVYQTSTDRGANWSSATSFASAGSTLGNGTDSWYFNIEQDGDDFHFAFLWKDDNNSLGATGWEATQRYDAYYMKLTSAGSWVKADGGAVSTFPVTPTYARASLRVLDSQTGLQHTNIPVQAIDSTGKPALLFPLGATTSHTYKFAKWNGSSWDITSLPVTTDHLFDDYQLERISDTSYRAYLTTGGSPGTNGDDDTDQLDRGGNVEEWITSDSGANWTKVQTVLASDSPTQLVNMQRLIHNYQPEAKLLIEKPWPQSLDTFTGKLKIWGSTGFLTVAREAETKALLARLSGTYTDAQISMLDTMIRVWKSEGIWAKLDGLNEGVMANAADARLDWTGHGYDMTPQGNSGNGPAFTAYSGFKGNGTDSYHLTPFIAANASKFTRNDAHFSIWVNENNQSNNNDAGWFDGVSDCYLGARNTSNTLNGRINQASTVGQTLVTDSSRQSLIQRTGASAGQFFKNNNAGTTFNTASAALQATVPLTIGKVTTQFSARTVGAWSVGASLSAKQITLLYYMRFCWRRLNGLL